MEKENKKKRDAAKKKCNEIVRVSLASYGLFFVAYLSNFFIFQALVAFVRKRDKRVQAYKVRHL